MQLKITQADGTVSTHKVSPGVEVAFERTFKASFIKAIAETQMSEHVCWLAWECLRKSGTKVPPFDLDFIDQLDAVEIVDDDPNG